MKVIYLTMCLIVSLLVSVNVAFLIGKNLSFLTLLDSNFYGSLIDPVLVYRYSIGPNVRGGANHRGRGGRYAGFSIGGRRQTQGR